MSATKEHYNCLKIVILVVDFGTKVLREKLKKELPKCPTPFQEWLKVSCHELIHFHLLKQCCKCTSSPTRRNPVISKKQFVLLFVNDRGQPCTESKENNDNDKDLFCSCCFKVNAQITEEDMDITLLSCFLINLVKLNVSDRKLVEKLRDMRNYLFHKTSTTIPTKEFEEKFQDITHIINEIAKGFDTELFETLCSQMIQLENSPQHVSSATELGVKQSEDAQTNTEQSSDTKVTGLQLQDYLSNVKMEDLQGMPEQILEQLRDTLCRLKPTTEETLRKGQAVWSNRSCFQSEIEMTRLTLDQHISPENVFHPTQQLQDSFHILYTKHILVLYGIAGSGKTTLAHEIMFHMREDLTPVILSNPDQVKSIHPHDQVLVLLDDIMGRSAYSQDNARRWFTVFQNIYISSRQGSPHFILAFRENVYEDFLNDIDVFDSRLFCKEHFVNVTSMTVAEKEELLNKYCSQKGVSIYYGKGGATNSPKSLDKSTFNQICNTETLTGFPQSCFLFFSNDVFFHMGQDFFKRPDQSLIAKVDRFRKSKDEQCRLQYAVLVHMMLVDGEINIQTLSENTDFKQVTNDFDLKAITYSKLRDCIEEDIMRSLLKMNKDEVIFRHQTVKEAVFLSFSNHFPDKILLKCKLQLVQDFLRSRSYVQKRGEVIVILQDRCFTTLSSRIIDEILQNNNYFQCVRLQVFEDSSFTKTFASTLLIALRDRDDSGEVVKKLLLYSSEHGNNELLSELLRACVVCDDNYHPDPDITNEVYISMTYFREEILSTAIRKGQVEAIAIIAKKDRRVLYRSKCGLLPIHTAIWTGIRPVCDVLWDKYDKNTICMPSFNDASGRRCIHYCAMRGYIDKIREIKSHGDEFVMAVDARSQSALHYAAYGGQYQILPELVGYGLSIADRTTDNYSVLQVLLVSLDYDERCKILPQIPQNISQAISDDSGVLWNNEYYRALEYILEIPGTDLKDLDVIIHKTHNYNVAHYACIDNEASVVLLLLNKRRELFSKRNSTRLPMVWDIAAFLGRFSILKTLFKCGLIHDTDRSSLALKAKQGWKQARAINLKDRRLLLNRHEREKIWPDCSFPFVIFGQEHDYNDIEKFLEQE